MLSVPDKKSGARPDNLGNIITLSPFEIKTKDKRRFECKFTESIAMANVACRRRRAALKPRPWCSEGNRERPGEPRT